MRKIRKADQLRLHAFPRWLHIPCVYIVQPGKRRSEPSICGEAGLVYLVSDEKQLRFEFGPASKKLALCVRHRDRVIAHGRNVKLCPGAIQFAYLKKHMAQYPLVVVGKKVTPTIYSAERGA